MLMNSHTLDINSCSGTSMQTNILFFGFFLEIFYRTKETKKEMCACVCVLFSASSVVAGCWRTGLGCCYPIRLRGRVHAIGSSSVSRRHRLGISPTRHHPTRHRLT